MTSPLAQCDCPVPKESARWKLHCRACAGYIDPSWTSNDETFAEFFDQLKALPGVDATFIEHCRRRELAGRPEFGNSFLARENCLEALEEAADLALYSNLHLLKCRREGKREEVELALEAARLAALAYAAVARLHNAG